MFGQTWGRQDMEQPARVDGQDRASCARETAFDMPANMLGEPGERHAPDH